MKNLIIVPLVALLLMAAFANAGPDRNEKITISPFYIEACDEWVQGEMTVHVLENFESNNKGDHYRYHFNLHGTGVGMTSGIEYVFNHTWNRNIHENSLPYIFSFVRSLRLISKGPAPNLHSDCFVKIVVNANGEINVETIELNVEKCK